MITLEQIEIFRNSANEVNNILKMGMTTPNEAFLQLNCVCEHAGINVDELYARYEAELNDLSAKYYRELREKLGLVHQSRKRNVSR